MSFDSTPGRPDIHSHTPNLPRSISILLPLVVDTLLLQYKETCTGSVYLQ